MPEVCPRFFFEKEKKKNMKEGFPHQISKVIKKCNKLKNEVLLQNINLTSRKGE